MAESDGKRGMTSKTISIMKQTMLAAALLLGLGWVLASCGNDNPSVNENPTPVIVEETTLPIEEETVDTLFRTYDEAEDTVMFQTYVFFSQPIPKDVELRMRGRSLTDTTKITFDQLRYLTLPYYDYDGNIQSGEMVCNKAIAHDLLCVFRDLFSQAYPIYSIRLVDDFDADDEASMQANNTSCFNYRNKSGVNMLSQHAYGMAVDVNPLQNPCVRGSRFRPSTAAEFVDRSKDFEHKIDENDYCVKVFTAYGFRWGGRWSNTKDYQHFEK